MEASRAGKYIDVGNDDWVTDATWISSAVSDKNVRPTQSDLKPDA